MKLILYTTNCPKCKILERKLKERRVDFETVTNVKIMLDKGFTNVPMLECDGIVMNFTEAYDWINKIGKDDINYEKQ